jgi:hypothetical protein
MIFRPPGQVDVERFLVVQDDKQKSLAEADAATARLQKSLRAARSLVSNYRAKLCRKSSPERDDEPKSALRFES